MKRGWHQSSIVDTRTFTSIALLLVTSLTTGNSRAHAAAPGLTVQANQLVTTSAGILGAQNVGPGVPVVLRGVSFSGSEYACLQGNSFWDNPLGNQATLNAMLTWHANVIRLPLNEECWLGMNGAPAATSGANYQNAMVAFIDLANACGFLVEVDRHWGAGGTGLPKNDDYPGLDADHAPAFWQSVARTLKNGHSVLFNLINEPHDISWQCLRDGGCQTPRVGKLGKWTVVGTQSIVNTIRAAGATNPTIIAGLDWSDDLTQWLQYVPADSQHQIIAGFHTYAPPVDTFCADSSCWVQYLNGIQSAGYPVIVDEFGETDCKSTYIDRVMDWADFSCPPVGYWAWTWTIAGCRSEPSLITNSSGNPTAYGAGFKSRLLSLQ